MTYFKISEEHNLRIYGNADTCQKKEYKNHVCEKLKFKVKQDN